MNKVMKLMFRKRNRKKLISKLSKITATMMLVFCILASSLRCASAMPSHGGGIHGSKIIGIDLGTTQSVVSYSADGKTIIIPNEQGNRITPSIVGFTKDEIVIGDAAYNQMSKNVKNTVFDVKRFIGRNFDDPTVTRDITLLPFDVVNKNNKPHFKVHYKGSTHEFSAEEISAMVLKKLKQSAESYLGETIERAVITVPAYFDDTQKQATKDAGTIAGLEVVRIINEPTSAAIAYGIDKKSTGKESNVIIFDLGGGTFDVSLLTLDGAIFEVQATGGNTHLGGEDFDDNVVQYMMKQFKRKHGIDLSKNDAAIGKLRKECEKAKRALSSMKQTKVEIENIANGIDLSEMLSRARFEDLNSKLFRKTLQPLKQILRDSGINKSEIDEIVLVGGSTRIPKIQAMVKQFFNGKELNRGINPDEAVAFGASIQAAMIGDHWCSGDHECNDILVIDAAGLSLGIETVGELMTKIIDRGTNFPVSRSKIFSTHQDNQDSVLIKVFQGERAQTKHNRRLGEFMLRDIPPQPRGVPQIEVKFEIDENGLLQVEAYEMSMGSANKKSISIKREDHNLRQEEIDEIIDEFERFEAEDNEFIKRTQSKTHLESSVFGLKSKLYDKRDQMEENDYQQLVELCEDMTQWMDDNAESAEYEDFVEKQHEFDQMVRQMFTPYQGNDDAQSDDDYFDHEDL
eukprot:20117_1